LGFIAPELYARPEIGGGGMKPATARVDRRKPAAQCESNIQAGAGG
jgi:hypothetical protein